MTASRPLVSCVMLTRNRRRFVSQALWYALRQEGPTFELIVLDDGEDSVADLMPGDSRVRYLRPARRLPLGARRNLACEAAAGTYIALWDDDAWYSPGRLAAQVAALEGSGADVTALAGVLHYDPIRGRVYRGQPVQGSALLLDTGSLLYRRDYWATHRFGETFYGDVDAFLATVPPGRLLVADGSGLAVALLLGDGLQPNLADPCWAPRPFDELARLLGLDLGFYAGLRHGPPGQAGRLAPAPITLAATFMSYDGYGSMAEYLALGLARAGAQVHPAPFRIDPAAVGDEMRALLRHSRPDPGGVVLCHAWWGENLARYGAAQELFIKTVWETDRLPEDWPKRLNLARAVIVPSQFAARTFRASGVSVPVEVVYEGIDPAVYHLEERPERPGLTALIVGVLAPRKNVAQALAAWQQAFAGDAEARLIVKARFQLERLVADDPRIRVVDDNEPTRGIAHWYAQADVLLALGNEGFGLPLVEGMATGLPVVALNAEAQAEVCSEAAGMVLPVQPERCEPVNSAPFGPAGVRSIPSVAGAARQLRWVAEHRQEARAMGRAAAAWVKEHRNVWDMGPGVLDVMERYMRSPRPLRRQAAVWALDASYPDPAWYGAELAVAAGPAQLYREPPFTWRAQVLHIQYAPGACADAELTRQVQRAHAAGIPVAVTEHADGGLAQAWEQEADVLVAPTLALAARLRGRWPAKRVELLPLACPPWQGVGQASGDPAGRRVALVGQPSAARGAWRLLAALANLDDVELIVFGPAPTGDDAAGWQEAAAGVKMRWAALPSSGAELARHMAGQADAAIFWHDDTPRPVASYAARAALASGVPVLCSQATEFADLAGAVYQPAELPGGIERLLADRRLRAELFCAAHAFCDQASWPAAAALHRALWRTLSPA